jgi:Ser/Thr protein kinase RdoA (MazF antagonist)
MAVAAKTYSFRAPGDLGARLHRAQEDFRSITRDTELSAHFGNEFELALLRRLRRLGDDITDGVFTRAITEAFVSAIERVRREQEHMDAFAEFKRSDVEGDAWRAGALKLYGQRIAEEE